jgi:threonine synthase
MAQVVYYFAAALQLGAPDRKVAFSVPTGNFGDVFAGYVAAKMGLPVERLIVATNVNDILHRALASGDYSAGTVTPTAAPVDGHPGVLQFRAPAVRCRRARWRGMARRCALSSDQGDAADQCPARRAQPRCSPLPAPMATRPPGDGAGPRALRRGDRSAHRDRPARARARRQGSTRQCPVVTLATAHPAKFRDAVERATGVRPALPARVGDLFEREESYVELPGDYDATRDLCAESHATEAA